ncbi:hypothetical protein ACKVMT_16100 [Halobacteriales archaeon Cl-PHB]
MPSNAGTGARRRPGYPHRVGSLVASLVGLCLAVGSAAAHGQNHASHAGESAGFHPAVGVAVFLGSVLLLGGAVYLDRRGSLDRLWADAGVAIGVLGLLASVALLLF